MSRARIAAATARGLGFGAVYGGRADAAGMGAIAAEYGGATEAYYRTLGPLCSDARAAWREIAEVCAATRHAVSGAWGQPSAPDTAALSALKHRLAETAVLVLSDLDRALAPLLAPWTRHGSANLYPYPYPCPYPYPLPLPLPLPLPPTPYPLPPTPNQARRGA
jgi:hypothetical protein